MNAATTRPAPLFPVARPCAFGCCPLSTGACDCSPDVDVDVDELTAAEIARFLRSGSAAQRAELTAWLDAPVLALGEPASAAHPFSVAA